MPKKVRELKAMLQKAGFSHRQGKGSHTVWSHPKLKSSLTVAGNDGDDAQKYLEQKVDKAIREVEESE